MCPWPKTRLRRLQFRYICNMEVTPQLVDELAALGRLQLDPEAKAALCNDMQQLISFFEQLQQLDTTGVEPLIHLSAEINRYRSDAVGPQMPLQTALAQAHLHDAQFFKVPKVIKK